MSMSRSACEAAAPPSDDLNLTPLLLSIVLMVDSDADDVDCCCDDEEEDDEAAVLDMARVRDKSDEVEGGECAIRQLLRA
jgi:hypothetical protein